jgi:CheY-like chemotaxis protein
MATMLLVEDQQQLLADLQKLLEYNNYSVKTALNGKDALETMENIPDLIFIDNLMPIMNGYEFVRTTQEHKCWENIPILWDVAHVREVCLTS